ncbi:hypothetical protein C2845_PM02G15090 [Panicum miliaceum]|uniref:Uncharacterized protein n=1 Tax=Panicum miliaceum TaxID=4540 RepID=A0A3L6S8S2_PANMI|nr:hypothetical protein C2845_PM02G15090 [Panicum miliaceum]
MDGPGKAEVIHNSMEEISDPSKAIISQTNTRQSDRLKKQGLGNMKIANKAEALLEKKNVEGNYIPFKNSFAVLSNNELIIRAGKLEVETQNLTFEKIVLLKDLEKARASLNEKKEKMEAGCVHSEETSLPL